MKSLTNPFKDLFWQERDSFTRWFKYVGYRDSANSLRRIDFLQYTRPIRGPLVLEIKGEIDPMPQKRGFAAMSKERHREIARQGGASLKPEDRSFSKNKELAKAAGRKGGASVPNAKRSFSTNNELAKKAGKLGGERVPGHLRSFAKDRYLAASAGKKGGDTSGKNRREQNLTKQQLTTRINFGISDNQINKKESS